jgi:hypothetical protein
MKMGDNIKVGVKEIGGGGGGGWVMGLLTGLLWLRIVCVIWRSIISKVMNIGDA